MKNFTLIALFLMSFAHANSLRGQQVDGSTVNGKVLAGYQGWFRCPGDGSPEDKWNHWFKAGLSNSEIEQALSHGQNVWDVDLFPNVADLKKESLCVVPGLRLNNGQPAYVFSSFPKATTDTHFSWMRKYGIDGALMQRFVIRLTESKSENDTILKHALASAEENGRVIAIEYDVTGARPSTLFQQLKADWSYLTDDLKITKSKSYLRENGKPVVSLWGIGFSGSQYLQDPSSALQIINWFKSEAHAEVVGGVPSGWASLVGDSSSNPGWASVYQAFDIIQPWTVGRYKNLDQSSAWMSSHLNPDIMKAMNDRQLYMPVIFPGFSWHNRHTSSMKNEIKRSNGEFFWLQALNAKTSGATMVKVAMFDELNEGTAIFKVEGVDSTVPKFSDMVTLNSEGKSLSPDWYLQVTKRISQMFHGDLPPLKTFPLSMPTK